MHIRCYLEGQKVARINLTWLLKPFRDIVHHEKHFYKRYGFWNLRQEDEKSIDAYLTRIKITIDTAVCVNTQEKDGHLR